MSKAFLKLTNTKAIVKISGAGGTDTIALATDLLLPSEAISGTPTVTLVAIHWTGELNAIATIKRNGVVFLDLQANAAAQMFFQDQEFTDNVNSTSDWSITTVGSMQIYLVLRKVSGYASKIETSQFSVYDNTNVVGS